jgi:5S rRNA maturation endonuclease (ribonuclease M5)
MEMRDLFDDEGKLSSSEDAVYRYTDEAGTPLFEVVRFYPKDFRQRLPNGTWSLDGVRRVPYRLPELVRAIREDQPVYVVEGEKDVHAIERAGGVATTNPGGAGKWRSEFSAYFTGATVIVVADKDEAGRKHAQHVKASLGQVASVLVVEPKSGKDAADHLAAGFALDDWAAFEATPTLTTWAPPRNGWRKGSERETKSLEFAWENRIVLHSVNLTPVGEEGIGKGLLQACLTAAITRGILTGKPERVGIAVTEEDPDAAVIPRLHAAGAELSLTEVKDQGSLRLPDAIPALEDWLRETEVSWLFLDTLNGHFGEDRNFNYAQPVEAAMNALAAMAARAKMTVCGSLHTNRGGSVIARERYAHQLQFRRSARSSVILGQTEDDDEFERTIVHDKHNYSAKAPALKAVLEMEPVVIHGERKVIPRLSLRGRTDATSAELFLKDADRDRAISRARDGGLKRDQCAEEIRRKWEQMGRLAELDRASFSFLDATYDKSVIARARAKLSIHAESVTDERGHVSGWIWRFKK